MSKSLWRVPADLTVDPVESGWSPVLAQRKILRFFSPTQSVTNIHFLFKMDFNRYFEVAFSSFSRAVVETMGVSTMKAYKAQYFHTKAA